MALAACLSVVAMTASACSAGAPTGANTAPSAIAPNSPWHGTLAAVSPPAPVNALNAVDCPTEFKCWAVGSTVGVSGAPNGAAVIATVNGGASWTSQSIPATVGYLSDIACSDQRHCTAVGQAGQTSNGQGAILATSNGGASWVQPATPPGVLDVTAVACQANHRCLAVGAVAGGVAALVSTAAGAPWVQKGSLPPGNTGATGVSCSDTLHCWATASTAIDLDHVAGVVTATTDGGSTWVPVATPKGLGTLNAVSCLIGSSTGSGALPFTSTSTAPPTTSGSPTASGAAPTTGSTTTAPTTTTSTTATAKGVAGVRCTVVGTTATSLSGSRSGHGLVLTTDNGGARWSSQPVTASAAALRDVSCTAVDACVAVGSSVASSAPAGVLVLTGSTDRPWKQAAAVSAPQSLSGVSCVSTSRCVVVGESISEHLVGG